MSYIKTNSQYYSDIANAIRNKNGLSTKYKPSQMATAITELSDNTSQDAIIYDITNQAVLDFVAAARTAYEGNTNVSIVENYKELGTTPKTTNINATGIIELTYYDGNTVIDSANGTYTLKHFSPKGGRISLRNNNGKTEWSKCIQPTGSVRFLDLNVTRNARDLGGWPCDGGTVKYGMLYRMTVPNAQDANTLLNRLGIRHQFDLRGTGGSYNASFPVPHYHVYSGYIQYTRKVGDGEYNSILRQIIEDVIDAAVANEPLLFHCSMGCDRTGTLAFYLEGILGMSDVDIDIEYELSSLFNDQVADKTYYYRYRTDNRVTNETDWVGLKNIVSNYTGSTNSEKIINYLLSIGVSAARLNAFRAVMIDGNPSEIVAPTYTVTNRLSGCSTNNNSTTAEMNQPYTATITANTGYKLDGATILITMGGTDISSSAYNNGTINIQSVIGNIIISISAAEIPSYTNQIPISMDSNGAIYNNEGYKTGYRLNSSGAESEYAGYVVTGYIPFSLGQEIIFDKFSGSESSNGGLCFYDANHTFIASIRTSRLISDGDLVKGQILDYTPPSEIYNGGSGSYKSIENAAYLRISVQSSNPSALTCGILGEGQGGSSGDDPTPTINYTITNNLTNCVTNNNATTVTSGSSYIATITANNNYTLSGATVQVTMGDTDITSTAYSNGTISIAEVTGNLVITISAVEILSYTNQIPISTDTSGNVFNGTGYKEGYRLNSSGAETAASGYVVTGFMPFVLGQQILFDKFTGYESSNGGIFFYDSSHTIIASNKVNTLISDGILVQEQTLDYTPESPTHDSGSGNMKSIENVAYIRIAAQSSNPSALSCGIIGDAPQTIMYSITNTLTNCSTSNNAASIKSNQSYTATISANSGYTLSGASVLVTMSGVDMTSSVYNNGTINIANVTGNIVIQITAVVETPPITTYTVQNILSHCSTNNDASSIVGGDTYSATITADSGYTLNSASVQITMGGSNITSSAYNNGIINISSVTDDLSIQITAVAVQSYTNQIPISTDANGNVYNTTGYKEGYRLNSSGAESEYAGYVVTGYIPFSLGQEIIFDKFSGNESSNGGICYYDSNHVFIASNKVNTLISDGYLVASEPLDYIPESPTHDSGSGNMKSIENVAYIRISAKTSDPQSLTCGILDKI